jgi:glycosyltransferase involved in cell wall biosynthesis
MEKHPMGVMKELAGKHIVLIVENEAVPFDRRMWNMARSLREFGAEVTVICPKFGKDHQRFVVLDGVHVYRYDNVFADGSILGYFREYATAFVKSIWLYHKVLLKRSRVHVVHVANPPDIFWPFALYLKLFGTKFVFDEHDLAPEAYLSRFEKEGHEAGLLFRIQVLFQRLCYRVADVIISTNETYRGKAVSVDPKYAMKTFVVRNGPDTRTFHLRPSNPSLKNGYRFMAAYIGVMAIQDGLEYVVKAVDVLVNKKNFKDIVVYLIGNGDDWERLKAMAKSCGVSEHIVFTGRIPDEAALEILSTADVCLSPDPYSPLNELSTMTKIMEYMCLGKAIVSFNLKENKHSAGDSALYVANNDPEAFADGILTLLADTSLASQMGTFGIQRVKDELSWEKQAEKLLATYRYVFFPDECEYRDATPANVSESVPPRAG